MIKWTLTLDVSSSSSDSGSHNTLCCIYMRVNNICMVARQQLNTQDWFSRLFPPFFPLTLSCPLKISITRLAD